MELLKFSKFKLQLRALVAEVRELRERERSATEQVHLLIQKQKQTEDEYGRKLQEMQTELASSNEQQQKLERQVTYLQDDNALLENKQKELQGTINSLLQSRENFINVYEESTCEMTRSIETRDRRLAFLSEKINTHLSLFDSIEKEAFSVMQVVDNVQCLICEKEQVAAELRTKLDKVSAFEKAFVEKIYELESKVRYDGDELRRKNKIISELEAQLEAAKISNDCQSQLEEIQKTLSAKEMVIQNLVSEKKALHFELESLSIIIRKIQETVVNMNEQDKRTFSSILEGQEGSALIGKNEDNRIEDAVQNRRENSSCRVSGTTAAEKTGIFVRWEPHALGRDISLARSLLASSPCQQYNSVSNHPLHKNNNFDSSMSEFACSSPQAACSEPQLAANVLSISVDEAKENCKTLVYQLDSEGSTTQPETLKDPGEPSGTMMSENSWSSILA